jgi:hypothetical protein
MEKILARQRLNPRVATDRRHLWRQLVVTVAADRRHLDL